MNKLLAITSGLLVTSGVFAEFSLPVLDVDAKIEFDTAYVSEGRRLGDVTFVPSAEVGLPLFDDAGKLYVGFDSYLGVNPEKAPSGNSVDPYVGFSYDLTDRFALDLGYTYHRAGLGKEGLKIHGPDLGSARDFAVVNSAGDSFVKEDGTDAGGKTDTQWAAALKSLSPKRATHELYAGIVADFLLNPTLYFSYNCSERKANIESEINHTFDLGAQGINGFALDLGARLGYSHVKKPYGIDGKTQIMFETLDGSGNHTGVSGNIVKAFDKKGWFYGGINADLVYSLNENTKARAGVEFAFNNAKKESWINANNNEKHNVWFSSAVEFTF
jgi:opacity protein-like surface antigen